MTISPNKISLIHPSQLSYPPSHLMFKKKNPPNFPAWTHDEISDLVTASTSLSSWKMAAFKISSSRRFWTKRRAPAACYCEARYCVVCILFQLRGCMHVQCGVAYIELFALSSMVCASRTLPERMQDSHRRTEVRNVLRGTHVRDRLQDVASMFKGLREVIGGMLL